MRYPEKIDLHMHTTVSDGTDTPLELAEKVREAGITLFSVTDHDAVKGCRELLKADDIPHFITGVEFSCKDGCGNYHILGYGYDPDAAPINDAVSQGHELRSDKLKKRLGFLSRQFGFTFRDEDVQKLFSLYNPGKPHIAGMMVKYGYAETIDQAISGYLNKLRTGNEHISPEEAIEAIRLSGGVPVLAHPSYGRGDELILGDDMDRRLRRLTGLGLEGVEAFYSGFTLKLQNELLGFAEKYSLYVTAGSDYHGKNKLVRPGDTNLTPADEYPEGLIRFLHRVGWDNNTGGNI